MKSLPEIRDLLLPGLWQIGGEMKRELDLVVDFQMDRLVLVSTSGEHVLFTREDIESGNYKGAFGPRVRDLLK